MSRPASAPPNPDAFADPASSASALLKALRSKSPSKSLTSALLASSSDRAIFHTLPLLLSTLQLIGECTSDRPAFVRLLSVLRARVLRSRIIKARFLLHAAHPAYASYWCVETEVEEGCYERARAVELADAEAQPVEGGSDDEGGGDEDVLSGGGLRVSRFALDDADEQEAEGEDDDDFEYVEGVDGDDDNDDYAVDRAAPRRCVRQVVLSVPIDELDAATRAFWGGSAYETGNVDKGFVYEDVDTLLNPFYRGARGTEDVDDDAFEDAAAFEGEPTEEGVAAAAGNSVIVRKVFSSIARPMIVSVVRDGADGQEGVQPGILVKSGDNLTQDMGVELIFMLLNSVWAQDDALRAAMEESGARGAPVSVWYDVLPVDVEHGLMQAVGDLKSLKEFDWKAWSEEFADDKDVVHDMVRSAAGAYIATYIIGYVTRAFACTFASASDKRTRLGLGGKQRACY